MEQGLGLPACVRPDAIQRGEEIGPETDRIVVSPVQRDPGHRWSAADPLAQQRGLAKAGRCRKERQLVPGPKGIVQARGQAWTAHQLPAHLGHVELGPQQRKDSRWWLCGVGLCHHWARPPHLAGSWSGPTSCISMIISSVLPFSCRITATHQGQGMALSTFAGPSLCTRSSRRSRSPDVPDGRARSGRKGATHFPKCVAPRARTGTERCGGRTAAAQQPAARREPAGRRKALNAL